MAVNGQPAGSVALGANLQGYDLGTITLPAGENEISFHSSAPAVAPSEIGADPHDARKLGFPVDRPAIQVRVPPANRRPPLAGDGGPSQAGLRDVRLSRIIRGVSS